MNIHLPIWKQYGVPEPVWASLVARKGDRVALAIVKNIHAKRQQAAQEAYAQEERLARQAHRRGPQVAPNNDLAAELVCEMSDWSATFLHTDKEAVAEGGWENPDYMKWWLNRNERNKRATAMHANRKGWTAEVEQAADYLSALKCQRLTLATSILVDAASESLPATANARLMEARAEAPQTLLS